MTTDWTSRCCDTNCIETRIRTVEGREYVEVRDTETDGTLLVTAAAWAAHEAATKAEGRQQAVKALRDLPHSLGEHRHLWALVSRLEAVLADVRDEERGMSDDG